MKHFKLAIITTLLCVVGVTLLCVLYISSHGTAANQGIPTPPTGNTTPTPMPVPSTSTSSVEPLPAFDELGRQIYSNKEFGFELKYSKDWRIVSEINSPNSPLLFRVSFGDKAHGGEGYDGDWFALVYNKSQTSAEELIKEMGKQFTDRKEQRTNITINNMPAIKVIVMSPSVPDWEYEAVILQKGNYFFMIGNGAIKNPAFDSFFGSFIVNI